MGIAVVAMMHNRHDVRAHNFVSSLLQQELLPAEIIIVDTSQLQMTLDDSVNYISRPSPTFNKSRALNIGIRASKSDYIMTTDIDFIFSPNVIRSVTNHLNDKTFVLSEAGYLPDAHIMPPFDWEWLESLVARVEQRMSPGTIQAAHRQFWFDVHGYDERFEGGLGGMDDDMWIRGSKHGLILNWMRLGNPAMCLHQWHPVSDLKGKCSHLFTANPEIIKNHEGWGE